MPKNKIMDDDDFVNKIAAQNKRFCNNLNSTSSSEDADDDDDSDGDGDDAEDGDDEDMDDEPQSSSGVSKPDDPEDWKNFSSPDASGEQLSDEWISMRDIHLRSLEGLDGVQMQIANRSFVQLMYDANPDIFAKIKAYGLKGGPSRANEPELDDVTLQEPISGESKHHLNGVEFERTPDTSKHLTVEQLAVMPDEDVADVFNDSGFSEPTDASVLKSKPKDAFFSQALAVWMEPRRTSCEMPYIFRLSRSIWRAICIAAWCVATCQSSVNVRHSP